MGGGVDMIFAIPKKQYCFHQREEKISSLAFCVLRLSLIKARKGRELINKTKPRSVGNCPREVRGVQRW